MFDTKQDSLNSFFRFKKLKPSYIIDNFKLKLFILCFFKSFFRLLIKSLNCIGSCTASSEKARNSLAAILWINTHGFCSNPDNKNVHFIFAFLSTKTEV